MNTVIVLAGGGADTGLDNNAAGSSDRPLQVAALWKPMNPHFEHWAVGVFFFVNACFRFLDGLPAGIGTNGLLSTCCCSSSKGVSSNAESCAWCAAASTLSSCCGNSNFVDFGYCFCHAAVVRFQFPWYVFLQSAP